jgi:hypothetical protein
MDMIDSALEPTKLRPEGTKGTKLEPESESADGTEGTKLEPESKCLHPSPQTTINPTLDMIESTLGSTELDPEGTKGSEPKC